MKVTELKALPRECGLRGYSRMRKAHIIELISNNQQSWAPDIPPTPPRPTRPTKLNQIGLDLIIQDSLCGPWTAGRGFASTSRPLCSWPTQQEMDIYEQQEMSKSRPQVKNKLNDWYDWLVNHVPKTVKDKASRAFKTFKDKIMGLYNRVTGSGNQAPEGPRSVDTQMKGSWRPLGFHYMEP